MIKSDSQLVIGQAKGDFEAKEARMQKYLKLTNQLVSNFNRVEFIQIPREQNAEADEVAWSASTDVQDTTSIKDGPKNIIVHLIRTIFMHDPNANIV